MEDQIQQVFCSGLSLSVVDGRLKVAGIPETVDALRPLLQQYRNEIIRKLQTAGELQNGPAMPEHTDPEPNATEATPAQQAENSAEALINKAVEFEYYAKQQGAKFAAYELGRLLAAVDIVRDRGALETACRELAAFIG